MLPPGHVAAGYLTAFALTRGLYPNLDPSQTNQLLALGALFGFLPDLDMFWAFLKARGFTFERRTVNHRKFLSHAPILWLVAGLLWYWLADSQVAEAAGLLLWLASWSHFLLDTPEYGIMWLWPFSGTVVALWDREVNFEARQHGFFGYWLGFLRWYVTTRVTFWLELMVVASAIFVYVTTH